MPLLKYRCAQCDKVFEALVPATQANETTCEACGGKAQRAYEGRCLFGMSGSSAGRGGGCSGECTGCSGCGSNAAH